MEYALKEQKKFWSILAKNHPALKESFEYKRAGRDKDALNHIISYFRRRKEPVYLFSEAEVDEFHDDEILVEADAVCDGWILGHHFTSGIDWKYNATENSTRDGEWLWSLSRHQWWIVLGRAYRQSRNEKYALEAIKQLKSFRKAWPMEPHLHTKTANMLFPGDAWRSIEAAIRIYTVWIPFYYYFKDSLSWDDDGWISYLNGIHDHATFIQAHLSRYTRCPNWMAMESTSLFQLGLLFPEFEESAQWQANGWQNVCQESCYQFDQNGVHAERTPVYHLVSLIAMYQAWELARLNGIEVPPYMLTTLERGTDYLLGLLKPDLSLPMIGDADRITIRSRKADTSVFEGMNLTTDPYDLNEFRAHFRKAAKHCLRSDFAYFASAREIGNPPDRLDYLLPEAGFFTTRSGWEASASYLLLTGVQLERGSNCAHSHRDAGHVEYMFHGEDVLIDTGRYLYGNCGQLDWWQYFASTTAHNTIGVDGFPMGHIPGQPGSDTGYSTIRNIRTRVHQTISTTAIFAADISHNGYSFLPQPIFHRRRVAFFRTSGALLIEDRLTGEGRHHIDQYFNFAPGNLVEDQIDKQVYHYQRGTLDNMVCRPLLNEGLTSCVRIGSENPKAGWVSYAYSEKEPIPQLTYSLTSNMPITLYTLFSSVACGDYSLRKSEKITEIDLFFKDENYRIAFEVDGMRIVTLSRKMR
jgi:hypothetical protein